MKNKKLIIAALVLAVVIAAFGWLWLGSQEKTIEGAKTVTVVVVHKDGTEKTFEYHTNQEYLGDVILGEGLVEGEEGSYGLVISAVDGEIADWNVDQSYWALYVGEEYATTGADGVVLTDGGVYKLVYTIG